MRWCVLCKLTVWTRRVLHMGFYYRAGNWAVAFGPNYMAYDGYSLSLCWGFRADRKEGEIAYRNIIDLKFHRPLQVRKWYAGVLDGAVGYDSRSWTGRTWDTWDWRWRSPVRFLWTRLNERSA